MGQRVVYIVKQAKMVMVEVQMEGRTVTGGGGAEAVADA